MRSQRVVLAALFALSLGSPLAWVACQNTALCPPGQPGCDPVGGSGGGGGGGNTGPYAPTGCEFTIAPIPEYSEWQVGGTVNSPSPGIRRVRVGLGGNVSPGVPGRADPSTTIGVAWETDDDAVTVSEIQWGPSPDPSTWPSENRAGGATWITPEGTLNPQGPARMHEVHVCGLTPDTTYYYRVGGEEAWSDVLSFKTTPSDPSATVVIGVSGDSRGQQDDAWRLIQRRMRDIYQPTLQMFSGDMINFAPDQKEWQDWLNGAERDTDGTYLTLGGNLVLTAHGNHDNHTAMFYGNLVQPQEPATYPKYGELFYSVDVGPVHLMVIDDGFITFPNGDPDYRGALEQWLQADLEAANASRAERPFIIAMHHHPIYSSSLHGGSMDVLRNRAFFAPIYDQYNVDMVLNGHDHNYERSKPLVGPAETPTAVEDPADGTTYLVCAGAGADSYSAGTQSWTAVSRDYKSGGALGFYSVITITPDELTLEGHELRPDGSDPVFDTFTITK